MVRGGGVVIIVRSHKMTNSIVSWIFYGKRGYGCIWLGVFGLSFVLHQ